MKTRYLISFVAPSCLVVGLAVLTGLAFAREETEAADIQYPVAELGGCKSETACRSYCDKPENKEPCLDFAQKNRLMSKEEVNAAKNFLAVGEEGPGGCKGEEECERYCSNISHIDECIAFAEEHSILPPEELEEAKKVQAAIKRGVKPPPCGGKKQCDIYCDQPEHMEECIAFGKEAGFIRGEELEDAQKMLGALKRGVKPPPCRGKEACDKYCGNPVNMEVCMTFAIEAGFMTEQEKADSQRMLGALKKGVKPPDCRGKEECDVYCRQEEHFEECTSFAEAAGFMTAEDAAMARKTKGKGPGDCKSKQECEDFCNNPNNQETCFNFAKEHGLIPEGDLRKMEEGRQQFKQSLEQAPPEVIICLNSQVGTDMVEKLKSGAVMPSREAGEQMRRCFEKMKPQRPDEMMPPGESRPGPGGCKSPEECKVYCESHPEECQKFQPGPGVINPGEQMMPQQAGPGGCKSPEECKTYCESSPQECQNFQQPPPDQNPTSDYQRGPIPGNQFPPPGQPCQGENCQYEPPQSQPYQPCQGEECQPPGAGLVQPSGQPPPAGQEEQPIPSGEFQPLAPQPQLPPAGQEPPTPQNQLPEQQPQPPAPAEPSPPQSISFIITANTNSLTGLLMRAFFGFIAKLF